MHLTRQLQESLALAYTIERELGGGGMSRVFLANETSLGRRVVIKVLPADISSVSLAERFRREISLAARLRHPHIVPLFTAGEAAGHLYYTMPFVEGETLRESLSAGRVSSLQLAVRVLREVADALSYAHQHSIVHRDIKPENILLENGHAVVTDFGVAKALTNATEGGMPATAEMTSLGVALGTVAYMAPEQAAGDPAIDHRADLYALGVVAYEIFTGAAPFAGRTPHQTVTAHMIEQPVPLSSGRPDLPPALVDLVMKLLAKKPDDRPGMAADVLRTLDEIALTGGTSSPDLGPIGSGSGEAIATMPRKSGITWRRIAAGGGAILVVALAGYGISSLARGRSGAEAGAPPAAASAAMNSVAVLPFANTDGNAENEHFSDGLTDELIGALGKVRGLRVAARTSVFALKGKGLGARALGDTLGVATLLEGSVRRSGNRLKVTVQLVSAKDGEALWSEVYDRQMVEVFSVQEEIAQAIAGALDLNLSGDERASLAKRPTQDFEAYDLYLRGLYNWNQRTKERMETALSYFEGAVALDPRFALPYAGMASAYLNMSNYGYMPSGEALARAKSAATRAVELDPSLAEAQASLGFLLASSGSFTESEAAFRRAIKLNPSAASTYHFYSLLLIMRGRAPEAAENNRRALALDPFYPSANSNRGVILCLRREFPAARRELKRTLELSPNHPIALYMLGVVEAGEGRFAEALPLLQHAHRQAPLFPGVRPALAYTYGQLQRPREADSLLAAIRAQPTDDRSRINLGLSEAMSGNMDGAFALFERVQWDVPAVIELRADPLLERLRADPRYPRLLGKIGLKP